MRLPLILAAIIVSAPAFAQTATPSQQDQVLNADQAGVTNMLAKWRNAIDALSAQNQQMSVQLAAVTKERDDLKAKAPKADQVPEVPAK